MEANPYLPPETHVVDIPALSAEIPALFPVSIFKLVVMSFVTLGGYQLVWFYQQWVAIKRCTGEPIMPFWRMFFAIVWCYSCFSHIHDEARRQRVDRWLSVGGLTVGWAITSLLQKLPDPWWLVSIAAFLFLIPIQREANDLVARLTPHAERNSRFTWANWLWILLGSLFWTLLIIGLTLPPEASQV